MKLEIYPTQDYVFIKRCERKETTNGGLIIPDGTGDRLDEGIVVAVGEGKINAAGLLIPMTLKPGDRVLFGKYAGSHPLELNNEEYIVLHEEAIMGLV